MGGVVYTPEMINWLKIRYDPTRLKEVTEEFNKEFKTNQSSSAINHKGYRLTGKRLMPVVDRTTYTPEMLAFIKLIAINMAYSDVAKAVNLRFGTRITKSAVEHIVDRYCDEIRKKNQTSNKSVIVDGVLYPAYCPISYEDGKIVERKGGIKYIKSNGKMMLLSRYLYAQKYGELSKDEFIIHVDGDKSNCDLNNLVKINVKDVGVIYNKYKGFIFGKKDYNNLVIGLAKLSNAIRLKEKGD